MMHDPAHALKAAARPAGRTASTGRRWCASPYSRVVLVYLLVRGTGCGTERRTTADVLLILVDELRGRPGLIVCDRRCSPGVSHVRRWIGMLSDYGLMGLIDDPSWASRCACST